MNKKQPPPGHTGPLAGLMIPEIEGRLFATFLFPLVWVILLYTPVPFLNLEGVLPGFQGMFLLSVMDQGLEPYLFASVLMAVLGLFIPFLRNRCNQSIEGRCRAERYTLALFVVLLVGKGFLYSRFITFSGIEIMLANYGLFTLSTMASTVAACLLSLVIASRITHRGLLHGISVYILTFTLLNLISSFTQIDELNVTRLLRTRALLANGLLAAGSILLVTYSETRRKVLRSEDGQPLVLRAVPAGIYPVVIILGLVDIVNRFAEMTQYQGFLYYFQVRWLIICGTLVFVLYILLAKGFYPSKILMTKARWGDDRRGVLAQFHATCVRGAGYLILLVLLPQWFFAFLEIPLLFNGLSIMIIVAIMIDGVMEFKGRSAGLNTPVAVFNKVPDVDRARVILEDRSVPVWVRSYHHRALLHFLGPYLEMPLLTREEDKDRAKAILEESFPDYEGILP